jgi:hypothetical protein
MRWRHGVSPPPTGPRGQAVIDRVLARVGQLESCEHDAGGFYLWISVRPDSLLCGFCYQAAQVLAGDITCAACGRPAGDPDTDATVVAKVADWLGVHIYLCGRCARADLRRIKRGG